MRSYGVGVLNGSLWTITVELQFYVLAPLLVLLHRRWASIYFTLLLILAAANFAFLRFLPHDTLVAKLMAVSFVPWLFHFMVGQMLYLYWPAIKNLFNGKFPYWILLYAGVRMAAHATGFDLGSGNGIAPFAALLLFGCVMSFAFTAPHLTEALLRRRDASYGIYLYHMPVINFLIALGMSGRVVDAALACAMTVLLAVLSWHFVERPALRLKKRTATAKADV